MSEKTCRNDHVFGFSKTSCPECGELPYLFDGMNRKQYNHFNDDAEPVEGSEENE